MKINRRKLLAGLALTPAVAVAGEMGRLPAGHETYEKGGWRIISLYGKRCFLRVEDEPQKLCRSLYGRWDRHIEVPIDETWDIRTSTYAIGTTVTYDAMRAGPHIMENAEFAVRAALSRTINWVALDLRTDDGPYARLTPPGAHIMMI